LPTIETMARRYGVCPATVLSYGQGKHKRRQSETVEPAQPDNGAA